MIRLRSITFRIIVLGVVLGLIGTGMRLWVAVPQLKDNVRGLAEKQLLAVATNLAGNVDRDVRQRLNLIERLAGKLPAPLLADQAAAVRWLEEHQPLIPAFDGGLVLLDSLDGHPLAAFPAALGQDWAGRQAWMEQALRLGHAVMGPPTANAHQGSPAIVFAVPVRDAQGRPTAVLAGLARLGSGGFLSYLEHARLGDHGSYLVVAPHEGLFVTASDPALIFRPVPAAGTNALHDLSQQGFRGTGITTSSRGVEELAAVAGVPATGWYVVARLPTAEAFQPVAAMRDLIVKGSVASVVVAIVIVLALMPQVLRPLITTARAMRAMAGGERELAELPVVRDDEVGDLVGGFNVLVRRLRHEEQVRASTERQLQYLAHHDTLTGLYNRAMLETLLQQAMAHAEREGTELALLFCDLDGFKEINDRHGHDAGDEVLRQVGTRLAAGRRGIDIVARLGGDEFIVVLTGQRDARAGAVKVAEQCLAAVQAPIPLDGQLVTVGMSIGITLHGGPAVPTSTLLSRADSAMYRAKHAGKGRYAFLDADLLLLSRSA
ncbi:MAG TPA: GGDEF domain-containing protein [Telluria sp.]|nr:GGDEF domain-containing protein [Telluria sp.]